jgi:high-affinity iron transporter
VSKARRRAAVTATHGRARGERIIVTTTTCAPGWRAPQPGRDRFAVINQSGRRGVIYLFHPLTGKIVTRIRHDRPHSVRQLTVRMRPGTYMWGCDLAGMPPRTSEAQKVSGNGAGGPPVVPVTPAELAGPRRAYRVYLAATLRRAAAQAATLHADIASGDLAAARAAWLTAHLTWLELGQDDGAYGIFGNLGRAIDGTSAGLPAGTASARFTGFHKIELELWRRRDPTAAGAAAALLARQLAGLARRPASIAISLTDVPLRCHEVLEDALRDTLSGEDDYGSGTGLLSVAADVSVTRELLGLVAPLVTPRSPRLVPRARSELAQLMAALAGGRQHGRWVAVARLTLTQRERINGAAGAALETLAPVPDLLQLGNS